MRLLNAIIWLEHLIGLLHGTIANLNKHAQDANIWDEIALATTLKLSIV